MNSRRKGKVGEREFASLLREHGFDARRGQQFCGGDDSPDVVSEALSWLHFEIKRVQNLNLTDACVQAIGDCGGKPWIVAHRRNHAPWLITMSSETFFKFLRGELPMDGTASQTVNKETETPERKDNTNENQTV
jgi:Holliday junction resolvase